MRVNVRVETAVSLSDFGSSVWGGSDESDGEWSVASSARRSSAEGLSDTSGMRTKLSSASGSDKKKLRRGESGSKASSRASSSSSIRSWQIGPGQSTLSLSYSPKSSDVSRHGSSPLAERWKTAQRNGSAKRHTSVPMLSRQDGEDLESLSSLSLHSSGAEGRALRESLSDSDSDDSINTRAPRVKRPSAGRAKPEEPNGFNSHVGVRCMSCHVEPIVGVRYHCASCVKGADFCADCERTGSAVRLSTNHTESHIMIKLATPLTQFEGADIMDRILSTTTRRLVQQTANVSSSSSNSSLARTETDMTSNGLLPSTGAGRMFKCSFCMTPIAGVRYLCANCPIVSEGSRDGYNLCVACEVHSLKCHDPAHFFIKLSASQAPPGAERIPLGDRWDVQEITGGGSLLPCLYSGLESFDPFLPPAMRRVQRNPLVRVGDGVRLDGEEDIRQACLGGLDDAVGPRALDEEQRSAMQAAHSRAHWLTPWSRNEFRGRGIEMHSLHQAQARLIVPLERLVHPSILCDSCFQVIHGAWYRCCHCISSYDLCGGCMSRIAHDPIHAFAVFKQPVDLDLFKSCVDHQDAGDTPGASRPMLSFPLT